MANRKYRFQIPFLPAKACSPNARVHWAERYRAKGELKTVVYATAKNNIDAVRERPLAKAKVTLTFILPDNRRRDLDNLQASFKAGLDGLVLAGVIKDDSHQCLSLESKAEVRKGEKAVIIEVEEIDERA